MKSEVSDMAQRAQQADRVTWLSVWLNCVLTLGKLLLGIVGHSSAMIADAIHSFSDFATDFAVMIGMRLARRPEDSDHPYGHGKYETLAAVIVGVSLVAVAAALAWDAVEVIYRALVRGDYPQRPSSFVVGVGALSVVVKEILYHLTIRVADRTNNEALRANAWHHRSDALSSVGTTLGVAGAALLGGRWVLLDPVAALGIAALLGWIAWRIVRASLDNLLEHSMTIMEGRQIHEILQSIPGVSEPHHLRTRRVGTVAVIDLHFRVDPELRVREAHELASLVEQKFRDAFGSDAIVTVHVEPYKKKLGATHA